MIGTASRAVEKLFKNKKLEVVALKRGKQGCIIYGKKEKFNMDIYPVDVKDPTGVGDCFDAGFLCGFLDNKTLYECTQIATAVASLNTSGFGPMEGDISRKTVDNLIAKG